MSGAPSRSTPSTLVRSANSWLATVPPRRPSTRDLPAAGNSARLLILLFLLSLLIQSVFLIFLPDRWRPHEGGDYLASYEPVAENILQGKGIVDAQGRIATLYPPGYPLILAMIFVAADVTGTHHVTLVRIVNVITMAASALLVFLMAELMFSTRVGIISTVLWMSYPFNLWLISQPNSEVPFILLAYLGIWVFAFAIARGCFPLTPVVGVTLALAALVRPIGLFLCLVLALVLLFRRAVPTLRRLSYALVLLIGFLGAIAPWEIHVLSSTGQLIPLSANGPASVLDGLTFGLTPGPEGDRVSVPEDVTHLMERIQARGRTLVATGAILNYLAQEAKRNPAPVAKLLALKVARSWYGTAAKWQEDKTLAIQVVYLALILGGIGIALSIYRDRIFWVVLLVSVLFYFWGMTVLVLPILRYMVPALGLTIIFAAVTVDYIISGAGILRGTRSLLVRSRWVRTS